MLMIRRLHYLPELGKEDERRFVMVSLQGALVIVLSALMPCLFRKESKLGSVRSCSGFFFFFFKKLLVPLSPEGDCEILFLHTRVGKPQAVEAVFLNINGSNMRMVKSVKHFCPSSNF